MDDESDTKQEKRSVIYKKKKKNDYWKINHHIILNIHNFRSNCLVWMFMDELFSYMYETSYVYLYPGMFGGC